MIDVYAVKSDAPGSRFICWGLGEPASHLAIGVGEWVFHSIMEGVTRVDRKSFWDTHHFVAQAPLMSRIDWESRIDERLRGVVGMPYDQPAFSYFAWCAFRRKFFGEPLPKKNPLDQGKEFLCVELLKTFDDVYSEVTGKKPAMAPDKAFAIMTPMDAVKYAQKAWP
jgi:hypothetical protein